MENGAPSSIMLILHSICMIAVILSLYHVYKTNIDSGYTSVEALLFMFLCFKDYIDSVGCFGAQNDE